MEDWGHWGQLRFTPTWSMISRFCGGHGGPAVKRRLLPNDLQYKHSYPFLYFGDSDPHTLSILRNFKKDSAKPKASSLLAIHPPHHRPGRGTGRKPRNHWRALL